MAEPKYRSCDANTFVRAGKAYGNRLDNFVKKFYRQEKFLTTYGLVNVFEIKITFDRNTYVFDADSRAAKTEANVLKEVWIDSAKGKGRKYEFTIGLTGVLNLFRIPLRDFKKVDEFGGQGSGGKKLNKGTQFEKDFYADAVQFLEGKTSGGKFIPQIVQINEILQRKMRGAISNVEGDPKLKGVLEEGSKNKSRPLTFSGNSLVVAAEGNVTENMGSTLTDITFEYGKSKKPVYLSLKFGSTLTFFNSGVGGRNGPLLFTKDEIDNYKITTKAGLALLSMFGMDMRKFCASFANYPRSQPLDNHVQVSTSYNQDAIEKLLRSGIGYGYWMVHNYKGNKIDFYEIDRRYMIEASKITGGITIYYGGISGTGLRVDMVCESSKYQFKFNIRNKQASGKFPTHVMCDYQKK